MVSGCLLPDFLLLTNYYFYRTSCDLCKCPTYYHRRSAGDNRGVSALCRCLLRTWEQFWGQRITWKLVEGLGSHSCIDTLSEAVPITACQYGAQLQLQWSSVPPEAGTRLLGGTCCIEQLYLSSSWLYGGDYIFVNIFNGHGHVCFLLINCLFLEFSRQWLIRSN